MNLRQYLAAMSCATGLALTSLGCGSSNEGQVPVFPVQGQVLHRGKPLADALVVFHKDGSIGKEEGKVPQPTGRTDTNGNFHLHTYTGDDGAPEGSYHVAVSIAPAVVDRADFLKKATTKEKSKATPDVLQMRYVDAARSNLKAEIKSTNNVLPPFDLQ
jgi:hypothetical protein